MPSIRLEGVSFAFADAAPILTDVDLLLPAGWTALVGANGAGKSTLLALLAGTLAPSAGAIRIDPPGARIALCRQEVAAAGEPERALAGREDGPARRLRASLSLDPAALERWETLSPGERKRWQVGAALAAEPDLLLLDEPTNHLDAAARALLAGALGGFRGAGVLVSHDRALLEALAPRTARLHRGRVRVHQAPYGEARRLWEAELRAAWDERGQRQEAARAAARRLDLARRTSQAASRARSGRHRDPGDRDARSVGAKTLRMWADERLGRDVTRLRAAAGRAREAVPGVPEEAEVGGALFAGFAPAPRPVLLSLEAPALGPGPLLRDVRVRLRRDDRVWLCGPNGSGKSTLLRALLAGSTAPPGRLLHLAQELSPEEGPALLDAARRLAPAERGRVLALVAALGSDPGRLLASSSPSPGEARKLTLALGLGCHAWALLLDEPTNHLDLPSIERLEAALAAYPGALLLATHDEELAARCTTARWVISGGTIHLG
ncbi:MAG: ABC-F family ATP-binding cassette domain-containing protein [Deltaproteobacteria bacterium]|nr:ABC-F family ATP-binding cassette domain-containing protein [Deltaproteobacteria bacterium]